MRVIIPVWIKRTGIALAAVLLALGAVFSTAVRNEPMGNGNQLTLKSSAFKNGETIPRRFTCDDENINPLLEIKNTPTGTVALALIMDDPDAPKGTWDHWVLWNIDPKTQYIMEDNVPPGAIQGLNGWGKNKYGGPCPPQGAKPHRYFFTLYALDAVLELPASSTKAGLEQTMKNHVIEKTTLMGLYGR